MRLIDQFYKPEGIDRYTFLFGDGRPSPQPQHDARHEQAWLHVLPAIKEDE